MGKQRSRVSSGKGGIAGGSARQRLGERRKWMPGNRRSRELLNRIPRAIEPAKGMLVPERMEGGLAWTVALRAARHVADDSICGRINPKAR